ncbi:MAG TPA: DNA starvation/stationary phase protection protein Dps [Terriglobales bacterium]|nr:DNA starvation/stationary phase protection protein Dps [Terriglobales bacterium]
MAKSEKILKVPRKNTVLFDSSINIDEGTRSQVIGILNQRLADVIDVQYQAKFAHWNVKGKDFYQLHLLFDTIAEHLEEAADSIAERITALGGRANGTIRQSAANSSVPEYDTELIEGMAHVSALAERLATVANAGRDTAEETDELGDMVTSDLFTEIVGIADKDLYFLESHLQR